MQQQCQNSVYSRSLNVLLKQYVWDWCKEFCDPSKRLIDMSAPSIRSIILCLCSDSFFIWLDLLEIFWHSYVEFVCGITCKYGLKTGKTLSKMGLNVLILSPLVLVNTVQYVWVSFEHSFGLVFLPHYGTATLNCWNTNTYKTNGIRKTCYNYAHTLPMMQSLITSPALLVHH